MLGALKSGYHNLIKQVSDLLIFLENRNRKPHRGRPRIDVSEEQLASLLSFQFKIADIATMLQVSPSTISRRIMEFGLSDAQAYSSITDSELEAIACEYAVLHPHSGQKKLQWILVTTGISSTTKSCSTCIDNSGPQWGKESA